MYSGTHYDNWLGNLKCGVVQKPHTEHVLSTQLWMFLHLQSIYVWFQLSTNCSIINLDSLRLYLNNIWCWYILLMFLQCPTDNIWRCSSSSIFFSSTRTRCTGWEKFDSGIATNVEFLGFWWVYGSIQCTEFDLKFTNKIDLSHWNIMNLNICFTFPLSSEAAAAQWGAKFLQCPHHGAKNSTSQISSEFNTSLSKLESVNSTTSSPDADFFDDFDDP